MSRLLLFLMGFLALVTIASAATAEDYNEFVRFEVKFSKVYSSQSERSHRFGVFQDNLREIAAHNGNPNVSYRKGINQFADLTAEEFKTNHLGGYIKTASGQEAISGGLNSLPVLETSMSAEDIFKDLPKSVDWREKGIISPVKDQGYCGSCWAHSTIEQVESYLALATGKLTTLSVQELVSCMPNVLGCGGSGGCQGGTNELGFNWIQLFGLVSDSTIPYTSGKTQIAGQCTLDVNNTERIAFVRGYETLMHNDLKATLNHLANVGPLSIALDADAFHMYAGGIFDECPFDKNININHGVQLVGYGNDDASGQYYWIVRNSWSESFGERGYIRIKMDFGSEAQCGIDATPSMGIACKGDGFNKQKVCGRCGILFSPSYPIGAMSSAHILP